MSDHWGRMRGQNIKTECSISQNEIEFGKPVKLPKIRRVSRRIDISKRSVESREGWDSRKELDSLEQTIDRGLPRLDRTRHFEQPEQQLTQQQHQLCFPPPGFRDFSIECLARVNSFKNITRTSSFLSLKDYRLGSVIGRGSCAIVRICKDKLNHKYAVKTYNSNLTPDKRINLEREINILKQVQHCNIIRFIEVVTTQDATHIVTELLENVSLADRLKMEASKKFPQSTCSVIVKQLCKAIQYLHGLNIVHRDIKLQNVLLSNDNKVKLIDFGFSFQLNKESAVLFDFCGTPHYIAPEVILKEGYVGKPADIWSLGVLIYRLVVGVYPFKGVNEKSLFNKILKADLKIPMDVSETLRSLLQRILQTDPKKRPNIDEMLRQEWFN